MAFQQTDIPVEVIIPSKTGDGQPLLKAMLGNIMRNVPVGFSHHKEPKQWVGFETAPHLYIIQRELHKATYQLGTLGGGNHFIELQSDEDGRLAIMIHSGSRNFGKQICDYYNSIAKELNEQWYTRVPKDFNLAFLPIASEEGEEYLEAMRYAQSFAKENRRRILLQVRNVVLNMVEKYTDIKNVKLDDVINAHHNYATIEHHMGQNVVLHRKGAISAKAGELGIIPGSMETASYIVRGKGYVPSFMSASHGSGRRLGRKEAERRYTAQSVIEGLKEKNIEIAKPKMDDIAQECGNAYKDIEDVISKESDLVEVVKKLTPLAVIKG